jgi:glycosyltransferase involved in cell wall biosynthesis
MMVLLSGLAVGGTERKSVKLVNEMARQGMAVYLAYLGGPEYLLPEISGEVVTVNLNRKGKFSIGALLNLRRFVVAHRIDIVLCMNQYPLLYAATLKLLLGHRSLNVILAINTTEFGRRRDRFFMLIYVPLMRRIEAIIYGCEFQRELWRERYGLQNLPSHVIYNGVDSERFDATQIGSELRSELGVQNSFVVGSVGRLDPEKNHSAILRAAASLNQHDGTCDVLLVGDGPERESLERIAAELDIADRVHFLGRMEDVRGALAAMDVFVLPSVSVETFSNAALEAMAMGRAMVLSNIAGAGEMVDDGYNGFLYEKHDLGRLTQLLTQLRDDPDLRRNTGARARAAVVSRFSIDSMFVQYQTVLSEV